MKTFFMLAFLFNAFATAGKCTRTQGKTQDIMISSYRPLVTARTSYIISQLHTPNCILHDRSYRFNLMKTVVH